MHSIHNDDITNSHIEDIEDISHVHASLCDSWPASERASRDQPPINPKSSDVNLGFPSRYLAFSLLFGSRHPAVDLPPMDVPNLAALLRIFFPPHFPRQGQPNVSMLT